ncbi:MAG: hypothetical protein ACE5JS_20835 [Nitrospinota bacterium]
MPDYRYLARRLMSAERDRILGLPRLRVYTWDPKGTEWMGEEGDWTRRNGRGGAEKDQGPASTERTVEAWRNPRIAESQRKTENRRRRGGLQVMDVEY